MTPRSSIVFGCALILVHLLSAGCSTTPDTPSTGVGHLVLFDLADPADQDAFIADNRAAMREIPGIVSVIIGPPLLSDREVEIDDFDIGLVIEFTSAVAYADYLNHPAHVELGRTWRSRIARMRIVDVRQAPPQDQ
jgi:hypothetical protein